MDDRLFRNAMGNFATGITVITTELDGKEHGMTANAFMSVSLNPKLVVISIGNQAKMLDYIKKAKKYAVSILAANQQEASMLFAGQIKDGQPYEFARLNGMPIIEAALVNLTCEVVAEHEAGDHTLFIGEVKEMKINENDPLLYFQGRYRDLDALQENITT
ncbi:flavin reductase family protein [Halalkalibacterium ligniniphilum]|uniref:flavin reductase family protein n=1 Tax=Halalkalibacterium ligniniphilum TaxID=1134413 RepID=UPI0003455725|nr:flavin reductase family protein [Halalkalibacterium ligniniphilum]